jgi:uncharacterized protein Yka (UPF0111/DUF47 family)
MQHAGMPNQAKQAEVSTLNNRLNRALDRFESECDRIERVLSRVNGTPTKEPMGRDVAQINPTRPMLGVVEAIENQADRLGNLANNLESVA